MSRESAAWSGSRWAVPAPAGPVHPAQLGKRSVVVASGNDTLRQAIARELELLRWSVRQARGAAEVFALMEQQGSVAVLLDSWLPDLDVFECVRELGVQYPALDILALDGSDLGAPPARGCYRGELLHALSHAKDGTEWGAWQEVVSTGQRSRTQLGDRMLHIPAQPAMAEPAITENETGAHAENVLGARDLEPATLPEFVGSDPRMLEVSRRIQLVAHRKTPVLVHGPTGTGKELVARALHRLSGRPAERFVAINCAAIPENLVEAELFGYARGAFTGAVRGRIGRIEAASGGTLFLDEVGELPLPVQSKLLRFLESGEVQRIGENETIQVDARIITATHRKLGSMAVEGSFRLDLLHRLSVFLIQTPALAGRTADIEALLARQLKLLGRDEPAKQLSAAARARLYAHSWPGNVRELEHTVERAWILSGEANLIPAECVDFGESLL